MAKIIYGLSQSLDGYVNHDAFAPGPELFRHFIEDVRKSSGSLYGRRTYELMTYWDGDEWDLDHDTDDAALREFAEIWRAKPKWVASRTLKSVGPNATLIRDDVEAAVRKLKAEQVGVIQVAGPDLAHSLGEWGLIDEYWLYLRPFVLGGGKPFFTGARSQLRFVSMDRFGEDAVRLVYAPI